VSLPELPTSAQIKFFLQAGRLFSYHLYRTSTLALSTSGMSPWSSFLLQPGIYQIHFSAAFVTSASNLISAIVGTSSQAGWYVFPTSEGNGIMVGDRLISVSAPNTTLQMVSNLRATLNPACQLVITRLTLSPSLSGLAAPK
jgi:hypothetical protein